MHHPLKVLIKQNIMSLMLHGVPGLPLLWCFQPNNKSQGRYSWGATGRILNESDFVSCLQQHKAPTCENNQRKLQIIWKGVKILRKCRHRKSRPELVLFTPAALSYFSVKDWLSCFSVTWCYPLYSHPEVSKIQYFQQFSSTYVWSGHDGAEGSHHWALKVTRDRETLLQRFFSSAWLTELSKSITVYNKIINVYFVPCIYFFCAIHFLLTSVNTLTMVTAVLVSVPAAIKNTACPGQQSITAHSHTHTEGQFRLQSTSRAYECHRVISCSVIWSAVSHNYRNPIARVCLLHEDAEVQE